MSAGEENRSLGKDHRVELERYSGPLDLLLYLIRQEEVDIHDIPISRILDRYLEALKELTRVDLDQAGEFLVLASLLMEIKTRSLLPCDEPLEDEELDPRFELVQKLLEYRKFKVVSEELLARAEEWARRFPPSRMPLPPGPPPDEVPLGELSLFELATAFYRMMDEVGAEGPRAIVYDDVPLEVHVEEILGALREREAIPFAELFPATADRIRISGVFLALLELVRRRQVKAVQRRPFGPIEVRLREDAPPP